MREICRIFLPVDSRIISGLMGAFPKRLGAIIQGVTRANEMRIIVPEGDDQIQQGVPAFPCPIPAWVAQWYCRGEIGRSAHALALYICPGDDRPLASCAPYDADDVRRCVEFLKWTPLEERPVIGRLVRELLEHDPEWGRWKELRETVSGTTWKENGADGEAQG